MAWRATECFAFMSSDFSIILLMRYFCSFVSMCCLFMMMCGSAKSQYSNVWAFGAHAGINFNTNPPQPISTAILTSEGSAVMCDSLGQLLMYTDGTTIWNRMHNIMPNGLDLPNVGLNITVSTSQGTIIIPKPGSHTLYYVFSLGKIEATAQGYFGKLYYSLVDMTLNGGLGDVVAGNKGILMDSLLSEHMTAVSGNDCNIWLMVYSRTGNAFKSYNIGVGGINFTPVLSPGAALTVVPAGIGSMDMSNDRSKMAIGLEKLYLYKFNADFGTLSSPVVLDNNTRYYGVSFSPDDSKLYAGIDYPNTVNQFDLSSGDSLQMALSKTLISSGQGFSGAIKRAPDGKVYYCIRTYDTGIALNVINFPNLAGAACQNVANGFPLVTGTGSLFGLPNLTMIATIKHFYTSKTDTAFCVNSHIIEAGNLNAINYLWENGSTGSTRLVNSPGTYWVKYKINSPCIFDEYTDTIKVIFDFTTQNTITNSYHSGMCKADSFLMVASNLTATSYLWNDGSSGTQKLVNQTGTYWVSYDIPSVCQHFADTFKLTYPITDYQVSFTSDSIVCVDENVLFQNTSDTHFNGFKWFFSPQFSTIAVNPQHNFQQPGPHQVMLTGTINGICPDTSTGVIFVDSVFQVTFLADKKDICTGEAINFSIQTDASVTGLLLEFGDQTTLPLHNETSVSHSYDVAGIKPIQLTSTFRACADNSFGDTIYVHDLPLVYLGPDTGLCLNGAAILLKNIAAQPTGNHRQIWNTGDTAAVLKVVHPGQYALTVISMPSGCSTTETIEVRKDCYIDIPNAFSPNNDGINDYFFPRQLLSQKLTAFSMTILNRWGQVVFETKSTNGHGWDGAFNGKHQPEGVYIYLIEAVIDGGLAEKYQGNVTLVR
jgi:gliding motility-associated-like protein